MIEYINKRMIDWAAWAKRRDDGGLGYPGQVSFLRMTPVSEASSGPVVMDAAAMEIEGIVMALKLERAQLHAVAYWVYLAGNLTMDRVARELGCHRDTVYTRLHQLHLTVMDDLHEITLAAEDRARKNKLQKVA